MHAEHNDTMKMMSDTVLRKIYLSLYLKGLCVRGNWRQNRTATYWPSHIGHNRVSFPFSWAAQPGAWGPTLLGAGFLYHILSPTGLVSKLIWLPVFTEFYNSSTPTFLWVSQIALIQPIHSQGYNILINRTHLLFTKVHFLFWQPVRVVSQYTTGYLVPNLAYIYIYIYIAERKNFKLLFSAGIILTTKVSILYFRPMRMIYSLLLRWLSQAV